MCNQSLDVRVEIYDGRRWRRYLLRHRWCGLYRRSLRSYFRRSFLAFDRREVATVGLVPRRPRLAADFARLALQLFRRLFGKTARRFEIGDRVAYNGALGAYSEAAVVPADRAVKVPDAVSLETAAAALLKGMTAEFLVRRCFHVKPQDVVLVHAAAGGVGSILVQWCKALGANVIATVGSEAKALIAWDLGADHVILYRQDDVAARVAEITAKIEASIRQNSGLIAEQILAGSPERDADGEEPQDE